MATTAAKATRDGEVRRRLVRVSASLADRLNVDKPATPPFVRDADLARIYELESITDFLEVLDAQLATSEKAAEPVVLSEADLKPSRRLNR